MKIACMLLLTCPLVGSSRLARAEERPHSVKVGDFEQEMSTFMTTEEGLPSNNVSSVAWDASDHTLYAGTDKGAARLSGRRWTRLEGLPEGPAIVASPVPGEQAAFLPLSGGDTFGPAERFPAGVLVLTTEGLFRPSGEQLAAMPARTNLSSVRALITTDLGTFLCADRGLFALVAEDGGVGERLSFLSIDGLRKCLGDRPDVRHAAAGPDGGLVVAAEAGLFQSREFVEWERLTPRAAQRPWCVDDVRAVGFGPDGALWFAAPVGVGEYTEAWAIHTGCDGLPYNDFTSLAAGNDRVWFGTSMGALYCEAGRWTYRQGRRWLPADEVRGIALAGEDVWFATAAGVGRIAFARTSLAEKAEFYEKQTDRFHRRTPYEFVLEVRLPAPGDTSEVVRHDSDNDGLWTSMYGAGECFAYAATKRPLARERATKAFEAMRFLRTVTQGGAHPAPPGFVARAVLPTSGPDPNAGRLEHDREKRALQDSLWKVCEPRWPVSDDGEWYWKSDTSSDELDGHYFLYALYHDLVAETVEEKARVAEQVAAVTDHLIDHGFNLVDHTGSPTRWGRFSPEELNGDPVWFVERGLNSLSMLAYLSIAHHITGDAKYREVYETLVNEHGYAQNLLVPKIQTGPGSGNQSDDEMAFMGYYHLIRYETDPQLRAAYALSCYNYWRLERHERNPFFNFVMAAACLGEHFETPFRAVPCYPDTDEWLRDAVFTLKRMPLDRIDWGHDNSRRLDIVPLSEFGYEPGAGGGNGRGYRVDGKVVPVDETHFNHWNYDPWALVTGGEGRNLADGAVFTLPYYMGLYHGFIE